MKTLLSGAFCVGAALAGLQSAHGQVLMLGNNSGVDVFSNNNGGNFASTVGSAGVRAFGFDTGGVTLTLDHIDISAKVNNTSGPVPRIRIFGGSATAPSGSALATLTADGGNTLSTSGSVLRFNGSLSLAAGGTYWIVLDNNGTQFVTWTESTAGGTAATGGGSGSGYYTLAGYSNTADDLSGTATTGVTGVPNFAIYTTAAVPEPQQYALVAGLGLCAFAAYRRRTAVKA